MTLCDNIKIIVFDGNTVQSIQNKALQMIMIAMSRTDHLQD